MISLTNVYNVISISGWHFMLLKGPFIFVSNNMRHGSVKNSRNDTNSASLIFLFFFVKVWIPSYFYTMSTYQYLPLSMVLLECNNFNQFRKTCFRTWFHYLTVEHISHDLILYYVTWPYLILRHMTLSYITSHDFILYYVTWPYLILRHMALFYITSHDLILYYGVSVIFIWL